MKCTHENKNENGKTVCQKCGGVNVFNFTITDDDTGESTVYTAEYIEENGSLRKPTWAEYIDSSYNRFGFGYDIEGGYGVYTGDRSYIYYPPEEWQLVGTMDTVGDYPCS